VFQSIEEYGEDEDNSIPLTTPLQQHYHAGSAMPTSNRSSNRVPKPSSSPHPSSLPAPCVAGSSDDILGTFTPSDSAVPTPPTFVDGMPVLGSEQVINHLTLPHHNTRGGNACSGGVQQPGGGGGQYLSSSVPGIGIMQGGGGGGTEVFQGPGSAPMYPGFVPPPLHPGGGYGGMEPPASVRGGGGMTQEERR